MKKLLVVNVCVHYLDCCGLKGVHIYQTLQIYTLSVREVYCMLRYISTKVFFETFAENQVRKGLLQWIQ